ncbi:hypothetical protein PFISCL1PPCAC_17137, partial [Pristionchus fissidentatus]
KMHMLIFVTVLIVVIPLTFAATQEEVSCIKKISAKMSSEKDGVLKFTFALALILEAVGDTQGLRRTFKSMTPDTELREKLPRRTVSHFTDIYCSQN